MAPRVPINHECDGFRSIAVKFSVPANSGQTFEKWVMNLNVFIADNSFEQYRTHNGRCNRRLCIAPRDTVVRRVSKMENQQLCETIVKCSFGVLDKSSG